MDLHYYIFSLLQYFVFQANLYAIRTYNTISDFKVMQMVLPNIELPSTLINKKYFEKSNNSNYKSRKYSQKDL